MGFKYYKSTDADVMAVVNRISKERDEWQARCNEAAALFDATPVLGFSMPCWGFYGVRLNKVDDSGLWTVPDKSRGCASHPRARVKGKGGAAKVRELKARYSEAFKDLDGGISIEPLLDSIGTDWSQSLISGFGFCMGDGVIYVTAGATLNDKMVEITVSEYEAGMASKKAA